MWLNQWFHHLRIVRPALGVSTAFMDEDDDRSQKCRYVVNHHTIISKSMYVTSDLTNDFSCSKLIDFEL